MKTRFLSSVLFMLIFHCFCFAQSELSDLNGYYVDKSNANSILVIQDGYFSTTSFQKEDPARFYYTLGGTCSIEGSYFSVKLEYHSADASLVGEAFSLPSKFDGKELEIQRPEGFTQVWVKQSENKQGLAGVWRISGRKSNGEIQSIPLRARKTLKVLTDERFQWIAMNTETGEFFGSGGGSYTFKNGKYTEKIEFFSRDNSRVGMSLSFDGDLKNGDWHHSGKSSKGDPIYEIWSKVTD